MSTSTKERDYRYCILVSFLHRLLLLQERERFLTITTATAIDRSMESDNNYKKTIAGAAAQQQHRTKYEQRKPNLP